jgi:hypothetical protein
MEWDPNSFPKMLQFNAKWLWKHCKRVIPPPEQLYPLVKEVYLTFGPLLDAKSLRQGSHFLIHVLGKMQAMS